MYILVSDEDRVSRSYVLLVVVMAHNLHVVKTERHFDALVRRGDETQGVQGKLKLWAHTYEDAALGFDPVLPAKLKS